MTTSTNARISIDIMAKQELSTEQLDIVIGGATLMSGAPNWIQPYYRCQPAPPSAIGGGSSRSSAHMSAF